MDRKLDCIKKAYEFLENVTPVKYDCGKICSKKCCSGNDNDGMLLFPGEDELFRKNDNFEIYFDKRYDSLAVRCKGPCSRNERPLSCRIFPYLIYADEKCSKHSVAPDIRALEFCPLISEKYEFDRKFLRALRIASRKLCENEEILEFIYKITQKLTDFNGLDA
jgi:hypothetical protein